MGNIYIDSYTYHFYRFKQQKLDISPAGGQFFTSNDGDSSNQNPLRLASSDHLPWCGDIYVIYIYVMIGVYIYIGVYIIIHIW